MPSLKIHLRLIAAMILGLIPAISLAQCDPLTTFYASGNNQDGIMFDVQALVDITVTGMPINCQDPGMPYEVEVYYRPGTHVGFENSAVGWTLIGDNVGAPIIGGPNDTPTLLPFALNQTILAGQTGAFYVTEIGTGGNIAYTDGVLVGALSVTDGNVNIYEGTGKEYAFAQSYSPRVPNFTLEYDCCPAPILDSIPESCTGAGDGTIMAEGQGTGPWNYSITGVTGLVWDTTNVNGPVSYTGLVSGFYTVETVDATGCNAQSVIEVTSDLDISLSVSVIDNVCFGGQEGEVEVTITDGTTPYDVAWLDAFADTLGVESGNAGVATFDGLGSTSYNVVVVDANGCQGATSFNVSQPQNPLTLTTTPTDALCADSLNGSIEAECDGIAPFTYTLYDVLGTMIDSIPNTGTVPYIFTNIGAGDYFVSIVDGNGCELSGIETLMEPAPLAVQSSIVPMLCYNEAAGVANIDFISGGTPPYDPVAWNDQAAQTGNTAIDLLPGSYTATITDANGCSLEETVVFNNPDSINLNPSYITDTCNAGVGVARTYPSNGTPPYTFLWTLDGSDEPTLDSLFAGFYEVTVTDANNCVNSGLVEVKDSINNPTAEFEPRFVLDDDFLSQRVLFDNSSLDADQYFWEFGDGSFSNFEHPEHLYNEAGDYLVRLKVSRSVNPKRCYDVAWDYVNVDPLLTVYIPNAFTPGRNGLNDVFGPRGEGIELESWDMWIYNRWGQEVWQTGSYDKFWDGTNWYTGEEVPMGTYVYHIKFREFADLDRHEYTGWVNVLRD